MTISMSREEHQRLSIAYKIRSGETLPMIKMRDPPPHPLAHDGGLQAREHVRCYRRFQLFGMEATTVEKIVNTVAAHFDMTPSQIKSHRRTQNIVYPRQIAMYLCRELTGRTFPDIARRFGGRDHTTILHGTRKIDRLLQFDAGLQSTIATLRHELGIFA